MSHSLVEVEAFDSPITVPDDGDAGAAASVNGAFGALANRTAYLAAQIPSGLLIGADTAVARRNGNLELSAFSVVIDGKRYSSGAVTVPPAAGMNGTTGLGWWYLYCYESGGALAFVWSQTAPDASATWQAGALDVRRYLGCAFSDASGALYPMTRCGREYRYSMFQGIGTGGAIPGAWTTVDLTPAPAGAQNPGIPPHARIAHCEVSGNLVGADAAATCRLMARTEDIAGTPSDERPVLVANQGSDGMARGSFTIATSAAGTIDMRSEGWTGAGGWTVYLEVVGFTAP